MKDIKKPIEETYFILKTYPNIKTLDIVDKELFPTINESVNFDDIGKYIDGIETKLKAKSSEQPASILADIVYLSDLSYYYIKNSGRFYRQIIRYPDASKSRLQKIKTLLEENAKKFNKTLKSLLTENNEDGLLITLTENYIIYLKAIGNAEVSLFAKYAGRAAEGIDFNKIKNDAFNNSKAFTELLEKYKKIKEEKQRNNDNNEEYFDCETEINDDDDEFFDALETQNSDSYHNLSSSIFESNDPIDENKNPNNNPVKKSLIEKFIYWLRTLIQMLRYTWFGNKLNTYAIMGTPSNSAMNTRNTSHNNLTTTSENPVALTDSKDNNAVPLAFNPNAFYQTEKQDSHCQTSDNKHQCMPFLL
jgi:hypothetical protein